MSVWQQPAPHASLSSVEGDLLAVRITVEAFLLEDILEALASAPFPINPEIRHHAAMETSRGQQPAVHIEFPVWRSQRKKTIKNIIGKIKC